MNKQLQIDSEPILLRGEEVATLLGISRAKAYRLMQHREIPVVTFGKAVRCPRESLLSFIREKTVQPADGVDLTLPVEDGALNGGRLLRG